MQDDILKKKRDVLGLAKRPKAVGGFYVTNELAKTPLFYEGTVVRCFCLGCGESTELVPDGAQRLAEKAGAKVPENWLEFYFESKRCIVCDEDYKDVSLKKAE